MKRFVFIGSLIVFVIIGFLVFDKLFFHLIFKFKPVPGSCLILEEKYCKTGELKYVDDAPVGIIYKVKTNTPLFSPLESNYSSTEVKDKNNFSKKLFAVGKQSFDDNSKRNWYEIFFDGKILDNFSTNNIGAIIKKGEIFGFTSKVSQSDLIDVILVPKIAFMNDLKSVKIIDNQEEMVNIFNKGRNK